MIENDNLIINHTYKNQRKSISLDLVLFRLFVAKNNESKTSSRDLIKDFMEENWGKKGLSRIVQRRVLADVARPSLVAKVYGSDKYAQSKLDL